VEESVRVLVTGGSGGLGRWTIRDLVEHGHEAVNADRRPPPEDVPEELEESLARTPYREVDLSDVGQVAGAMRGCDGVVHLGAIPGPYRHPDEVVFANNTLNTFAVLQAAALLGVRRAVVASSISALGMAWARESFFPLYAPVDEEHPLLVQDPYGLSKEVDERTCAMFNRQTGMQVAALRFHYVAQPGAAARAAGEARKHPERHANNLWGYVDARDAALACRLALVADFSGAESFNVTAADTLSEEPTEDLIRRYCEGTEVRARIPGTQTAFSIEKARRLLGYEPRHSWRDSP
jgi:nucleoside-diphosphate-sugar epimerase